MGSSPPGALVIGGDYRGLGIVRSLGRRGIPVWVLTDEHQIGARSRYARRHFPWPEGSSADQVQFLLELGSRFQLDGWALFPTGDETAALVARHYDELSSRFRLTTSEWDVMRWAYDKRMTHQLADQLGINYPATSYPASEHDILSGDYSFPVIIKPALKISLNELTLAKAWQVEDHEQLLHRYQEARALVPADAIMVQDLITGGGESQFSYAALCIEGEPVAALTARRTRQYPIDFGRASTFVETVDEPEVERIARRLLQVMRMTGLVEVEFKRDPQTRLLNLLDINARIWGWHSIGKRAGVDFPYLQWELVNGRPVPETRARSGVRWVRGVTDLPAVLSEMRHGHRSLRSYFHTLAPPIEYAILAADDPLPGLTEIPILAVLALRRRGLRLPFRGQSQATANR